jgi:hypothetical protein
MPLTKNKGDATIFLEGSVEDDSSSSSSPEQDLSDIPVENERRTRANSNASLFSESSFPSIQTAAFLPDSTNKGDDEAQQETAVSADQERQILLLMLLAQVCVSNVMFRFNLSASAVVGQH